MMKRPSYKAAIAWLALNDGPGDDEACDPEMVSGLTTVILVADLFGVEATKVAHDVVKFRTSGRRASAAKEGS
jgi:hypothetical protein